MTAVHDISGVLRLKAGELLLRYRETLEELDSSTWPTPGSETARRFLLDVIRAMEDASVLEAAAPPVYLAAARSLDVFTDAIAKSSTGRLSWPLVTYCKQVWDEAIPTKSSTAFYTVLDEYNYELEFFSDRVLNVVLPVLSSSTVLELEKEHGRIYCIKVARLEDANLSLYGLLGHEIGHAVWHEHRDDLTDLVLKEHFELIKQAFAKGPGVAQLYGSFVLAACEELFCDLFAARAIGPAYAFSCMEFTAGDSNTGEWTIQTSNSQAEAHPSWVFRCMEVHARIDLQVFVASFDKEAAELKLDIRAAGMLAWHNQLLKITESAFVRSNSEDGAKLQLFLDGLMKDVKAATKKAIVEVEAVLKTPPLPTISARDIAALVERVKAGILPNIIPDKTLLGRPAEFRAILACLTIYRHWLLTSTTGDRADLLDELDRVDRFAAKAMEVAYIQAKFKEAVG